MNLSYEFMSRFLIRCLPHFTCLLWEDDDCITHYQNTLANFINNYSHLKHGFAIIKKVKMKIINTKTDYLKNISVRELLFEQRNNLFKISSFKPMGFI